MDAIVFDRVLAVPEPASFSSSALALAGLGSGIGDTLALGGATRNEHAETPQGRIRKACRPSAVGRPSSFPSSFLRQEASLAIAGPGGCSVSGRFLEDHISG